MSVVEVLRLFVSGTPVPQGSKTAYVVGKRAVVADANGKALKPWRKAVTEAAVRELAGRAPLRNEPVAVSLRFRFVRPKSVRRAHPHVKPDIDKLARAVLDGLTDAGVWGDDAQVIDLHPTKSYAEEPGVLIRVGRYINEEGTTR